MVLSPKAYIEQSLGTWLLSDPEFNNKYEVVSTAANTSEHLDGFMATIFMCDVVLQSRENGDQRREERLVVKVMKGTQEFRDRSKSFVQCRNEVFIYGQVIPYLKEFIKTHKSSIDAEQWTPKIYHLYYGKVPEISNIDECILVMENISGRGFKGGPRLELDMNHFRLMIMKIAEFHAVQYAMRIVNDPKLEVLKNGLTKLGWKGSVGPEDNLYEVLYPAAFERLFDYLDRHPEMYNSAKMKEEVDLLRTRFGKDPVSFLEHFGIDDKDFSVIQHGDYNRNNVLFKYNSKDPVDVRMIDFQEVRYGSPAFDLFFFLYMSSTQEFREKHWDELIQYYHGQVWKHLKDLLKCDDSDERIKKYSYESFLKHFSRFAFYGALVTIHFLPWMDADPEELEPLATEFTTNMKSEKCRNLLLTVGGDASNQKVAAALQHACARGYLSFIKDL